MNFGKFGKGQEAVTKPEEAVAVTKPNQVIDGIATITLSGKIDATNFEQIQKEALEFLEREDVTGLIFQFKKVSYVSSAGLRMFSAVHKKTEELGKSYKLVQMRVDILKLFQMTGYASAFCIETDES